MCYKNLVLSKTKKENLYVLNYNHKGGEDVEAN